MNNLQKKKKNPEEIKENLYFVSKIVLTNDWEKLLKLEAEGWEFAKFWAVFLKVFQICDGTIKIEKIGIKKPSRKNEQNIFVLISR